LIGVIPVRTTLESEVATCTTTCSNGKCVDIEYSFNGTSTFFPVGTRYKYLVVSFGSSLRCAWTAPCRARKNHRTCLTMSAPSTQRFDITQLIQDVTDQETAFYQSDLGDFGHPDPPKIQTICIKQGVLLFFAYSPHFVFAQVSIVGSSKKKRSANERHGPRQVCRLESENGDEEVISCLTAVCLEDENLIRALSRADEDDTTEDRVVLTNASDGGDSTVNDALPLHESAAVLLKGMVSVSAVGTEVRVAVVLGTNYSRVYAVEMKLGARTYELLSDDISYLCEVLPRDDERTAERIKRRRRKLSSFQPTGGVSSVLPFRCPVDKALYVWITYGDATMIKLHFGGFFASIWQLAVETGDSLDDIIGTTALLRCQMHLTKAERENSNAIRVVPFLRSFPSPFNVLENDLIKVVPQASESDEEDSSPGGSYQDPRHRRRQVVEAIVYGTYEGSPTLSFYTSEVQLDTDLFTQHWADEESESDVIGAVFGGTRAIVGGMVGLGLGALRWTLSGGTSSVVPSSHSFDESRGDGDDQDHQDLSMEVDLSSSPFPSLWREPITLHPGYDFPDPPRQIESCLIDPDGEIAAFTDNLGRVLLFNLATKQMIRIWKGYRDASCSWIHHHCIDGDRSWQQKPILCLAIYSKLRRVVEVWHVRQGRRLKTVQVESGIELLPCPVGYASSRVATSYLLNCRGAAGSLSTVEELRIDGAESNDTHSPTKKTSSTAPSRDATFKLQHLRQLLSTPTVRLDANDVYEALRAITSVADLASALDLLSEAAVLEEKLGVTGATFQKLAVALCNENLIAAIKGSAMNDVQANPNVALLSRKIEYHSQVMLDSYVKSGFHPAKANATDFQIIKAYDILHKFETTPKGEERNQNIRNPSHWVMEGMGWASTYQKVTRINLDEETHSGESALHFWSFASGCQESNEIVSSKGASKIKVFFSNSSKTRRDILVHVFKPLLSDIFSSRTSSSIFDTLGTGNDHSYVQKCFGEWAMTLPIRELYHKGLLAAQSPLTRFLKDIAAKQLDKGYVAEKDVVLGELHSFCSTATDLVRSFMLAVTCRDAAEKAAMRKEKLTYGRVVSSKVLRDWDALLRKLRVCLLVSLRLQSVRLAAPLSISTVEDEDVFSVFEWLAHDELMMTHKHDELVTLEKLCKISSVAFDPSTSDGDGPSRFKQLQKACLCAANVADDHTEYLLAKDDDTFGTLLLFFRSHNQPTLLAAHRARLLVLKWRSDPTDLELLRNAAVCVEALEVVEASFALALALALYVWQGCVSPVYKAQLVGFDDVHGLSEEVFAPLFYDEEWLDGFGRVAMRFLHILRHVGPTDGTSELSLGKVETTTSWPPVRADHILSSLVERTSRINHSALDIHTAAVITLLISRDSEALVRCIPGIYDCFEAGSLSKPMVQSDELQPHWFSFIEDAVLSKARLYEGAQLESVSLGEIETLCKIWGFDVYEAHTLFLLAMYEVGKDRLVDDLLSRGPTLMNSQRFVEGGVDIACRRIHAFLSGKEMQSEAMRETLGMLDAELCEWIKTRARMSLPSTPVLHAFVSVGQTHLFALRLLSLSASSDVDTSLRVKIHSMVVLSGTLVKVLEIRNSNGSRRSSSVE
jgi:Rab3 GTPase-activating protein regulatory subunit N-terminus